MHIVIINGKQSLNLEESKGGVWEASEEERKGCNYAITSETKRNNKKSSGCTCMGLCQNFPVLLIYKWFCLFACFFISAILLP